MTRLFLSVMGPFQAAFDGQPVIGFESDKVRALLTFLAVESDRPHRREALAGLLWPERPERSARQNLSQALFNLRRAIGDYDALPAFLIVTRQALQFNRASDHWLDVTALGASLDACQEHRHRRLETCDLCIDRLRQAVVLYRGSFLEGFSLSDSPAFEEWAVLQRERFHRLIIRTLHRLADGYEQRGKYEQALQHARRQVELDPWREEAQRQLMRLFALNGQRSAALAQYRACRRTLTNELGTEPEKETRALYERIRDGAELRAPPHVPSHNLPTQLTPFVGREVEMAEIEAHLQDPACRLLTLVGPGGIGKTRLALEAAWTQVNAFTHGVSLVRMAPLQTVEAIVPAVAQAIRFTFYRKGKPKQQLLEYLRRKNMLLILDNFEHLLDGVGVVIEILRTAANVKIMVTSRTRLKVHGEYLFPVAGMDFPETQRVDDLTQSRVRTRRFAPSRTGQKERLLSAETSRDITQYSAVKLFLQSARRVRPDFESTASNLTHIVCICRLVKGMPLAILLAAAWVEMFTPAEIATGIDQSIDFLTADLRDVQAEGAPGGVSDRQRSIRATFDHSWSLLTEREREVFQGLSVFRGGFTEQAARQVTSASSRELRALANKSLLRGAPSGRYEMHELLRQYTSEKLERSPAASKRVHDKHCSCYAATLQQWGADLRGARQQTALAQIEADGENARAAWTWAAERRQLGRLDQAMDGLCRFYQWRGRYEEGEAACQRAAEKLAATASSDGLRVLAKIMSWQSHFSQRLGRTRLADQLLRESMVLLDSPALADHDTRPERASLLLQLGRSVADPDPEEARELYEQSLALYREIGDELGRADALAALSWLAWHLGDYDQARQLQEESLVIWQERGDQRGIARSLMVLGVTALFQGHLEEGERLVREGLAIHRKVGDRVGIAGGLEYVGGTFIYLGKFAEARSMMEESLGIYDDLGFRYAAEGSMLDVAAVHLGQYEQARTRIQESLALFRSIDVPPAIGGCLSELGRVALAMEAYAEAKQLLQESVAIHRGIEQPHELSRSLAFLGIAARGQGNLYQAQRHLCEALRIASEIGAFLPLVTVLPAISLFLVDQGDEERSVELYALASRYPHVANSRWFEDVVGEHIAAVAATLPPDVVAAAQKRGRTRDLKVTAKELLAELQG